MLSIEKLKEFTSFDSWFAFYNYLLNSDWFEELPDKGEQLISIQKPLPPTHVFDTSTASEKGIEPLIWRLKLSSIKASAFDEIFLLLPTRSADLDFRITLQSNPFAAVLLFDKLPHRD